MLFPADIRLNLYFFLLILSLVSHLGISPSHITWPRVTMTSDQWICIRHPGFQKNKHHKFSTAITVLNPHCSFPKTWEAAASSAKMNPEAPIIGLRAGLHFQVIDIESRKNITKYQMSSEVHFWTWINTKIIAIVTETAVFHWNVDESGNAPQKIFLRHSRLEGSEIVNYTVDSSIKWCALTGLLSEEGTVGGITQVYSVEKGLSQCIQSHSVCFTNFKFRENVWSSTVMIVTTRPGLEPMGKVHVVELGSHKPGNFAPVFHTETFDFQDPWGRFDFPVSVQVSSHLGLVYVTTKFGSIYLFDLESVAPLYTQVICPDIVFSAVLKQDTQGILAVARNGQVLSIDLKRDHIVKYVEKIAKRASVAERLSCLLSEG
ncbi:clathrin heavy chain 1-like isoform X1 [Tachypleus tridentatus]|uniref:clathrin heavy chain 1-like isoform X1 n=1 Tax=Tachypleus tridentatus TaxID=6853 RepID=UPI003FD51DF7